MNRKTALISAVAVAGTLLVGTGAIAANIAVLNSADDDSIGNLSAEMPVPPAELEPQVVDVYVEEPAPTTTAAPTSTTLPAGQEYKVEEAGSVTIKTSDSGVFVDTVVANPGWEWSAEQPSPNEVHVTMTTPDKTYEVYATLAADGTIDVRVDQPVVNVVRVPAPDNGGGSSAGGNTSNQAATPEAPSQASNDNDSYEDDEDDDYEDDDRYEDDDDDDHYEDDDEDEVDEVDEEDDDERDDGHDDDEDDDHEGSDDDD